MTTTICCWPLLILLMAGCAELASLSLSSRASWHKAQAPQKQYVQQSSQGWNKQAAKKREKVGVSVLNTIPRDLWFLMSYLSGEVVDLTNCRSVTRQDARNGRIEPNLQAEEEEA